MRPISFKRSVDVVLGAVGLVAVAPVMLLIAAAIKLTSPGPVLFRQERLTAGARPFAMLKFRTMRVGAENETGPVWAVPDDPRRTPIGACLRRWNLDELPQLWNVLCGDMSLVGPRPERPCFVEQFQRRIPDYALRHTVPAGLTGWAQVNGWRGDTSIEARTRFDLYYVERRSLGLDLKILALTLLWSARNRNAY